MHAGEDTDQPTASSTRNNDRVWSGVVYGEEGGELEKDRAVDQMLLNPERGLYTPRGD